MKFEKVVLSIAVGLILCGGLAAQAADSKIGFVDAQQVLATVESRKKAQEELEREAREAQARSQDIHISAVLGCAQELVEVPCSIQGALQL